MSSHLQAGLQQLVESIQGAGAIAPIAYVLLYALAAVAFVPGTVLTLSAGVIFGFVQGTVYAWLGATLGATMAFLAGRYLVRGWVVQKIANRPRFQALDRAVSQAGFKIVLLTRLSPVFPFNLLNYAFGVTSVAGRDYVLGSIGMLPITILYVYVGSLAGSLTQVSTTTTVDPRLQWLYRAIGLLATLAVTTYVTRIARKALSEVAPQEAPNA